MGLPELRASRFWFLALALLVIGCRRREDGASLPTRAPLPLVPIGSWSEYLIHSATGEDSLVRVAVVARDSMGTSVESTVRAISAAEGSGVTVRVTYAAGRDLQELPVSSAIQVSGFPAMMRPPVDDAPDFSQVPLLNVDPRRVLGVETLNAAGTSWQCAHVRESHTDGSTWEFWVSGKVVPLGLVKLHMTMRPNDGGVRGETWMHLLRTGTGAWPRVSGERRPYDQRLLMEQMVMALDPRRKSPAAAP